MYNAQIQRIRGDQIVQPVILTRAGFDWSGVTVTAQVRETPDGAVLATPSISTDTASLGTATVTLTLPGATTAALPKRVVMEMQVEKSSVSFGPYTVLRLTIDIAPDYARPA
jgi:hypothetical protein